jgi:acyl-CoA thioester hydrolase
MIDESWTDEPVRVRYGETDQMGHAYYANYLFWFEQARGAWCRARGFDYKDLETMGFMLPVVEVHVNYRAEIKYDEVITVRVRVTERRRASIKFEYEILRDDLDQPATLGYSWHVLMGTHRKAVSIAGDALELLSRPVNHPRSTN